MNDHVSAEDCWYGSQDFSRSCISVAVGSLLGVAENVHIAAECKPASLSANVVWGVATRRLLYLAAANIFSKALEVISRHIPYL